MYFKVREIQLKKKTKNGYKYVTFHAKVQRQNDSSLSTTSTFHRASRPHLVSNSGTCSSPKLLLPMRVFSSSKFILSLCTHDAHRPHLFSPTHPGPLAFSPYGKRPIGMYERHGSRAGKKWDLHVHNASVK